MTKLITPVHSGICKNTNSSALGSAKAKQRIKSCPQQVAIHDILRDDFLQVRARVEPKVVRQYAEAMKAGAEFPPIILAHIDGSLYLVDGWHRLEAALVIGQDIVWADVCEMTFDEARWQAAKANTQHGLPLKTAEYREVFRAFIESGHHRPKQRLMPYREISRHIGKGFSTIRNWMQTDYPELFAEYQDMANAAPDATASDRNAKLMRRRLVEAEAGLRNARNIDRTLDPSLLGELVNILREILSDLESQPYVPVTLVTDF
jgi:hypothetical protein